MQGTLNGSFTVLDVVIAVLRPELPITILFSPQIVSWDIFSTKHIRFSLAIDKFLIGCQNEDNSFILRCLPGDMVVDAFTFSQSMYKISTRKKKLLRKTWNKSLLPTWPTHPSSKNIIKNLLSIYKLLQICVEIRRWKLV